MNDATDDIPHRNLSPDATDLLAIVCQHLEIHDKQKEILSNLEIHGSTSELSLIEKLFSPSDSNPLAVIFYKAITNERKLFRVPVDPGTNILQHKSSSRKSRGSNITANSSHVSTTILSKHSSGSSETSLEVLAKVKAPSMDLKIEEQIDEENIEAEMRRLDSSQYLVFARTYTRVKIHVRAAPLTDKEAHKLGVERCVCVVRRPDILLKDDILSITSLFEINIVLYPILSNFNDLISKVYQPLLAYFSHRQSFMHLSEYPHDSSEDEEDSVFQSGYHRSTIASSSLVSIKGIESLGKIETGEIQRLRDEFAVNLYKFQGVLNETESALLGVFQLPQPDFPLPALESCIVGLDEDTLEQFKKLIDSWNAQIDDAINELIKPRSVLTGPLEEVDYWRYRYKTLTSINEALKDKAVLEVAELWNSVTNAGVAEFNRTREIRRLMAEAKDIARFLLLVERHFKNIQFGHSFNIVADTIAPMMQSLRLIWTISRCFNQDKRMGPLLQKIAWALNYRVIRVMHIPTLFSQSIKDIIRETSSAIRMLTAFETTYNRERQQVEVTSPDNRWEFDRRHLFGRLRHVTKVLNDILDMANSAKEFYRMFGPELKNITGESKALIEVVRRVDNLFTSLKNPNMKCPFLPQNITTWSRIVEDFDNKVTSIDAKAKNFVNDYFTRVRGTNNAFNLLERFKAVKARGAISCLLKDKYRDVLRSLGVELTKAEKRFNELKDGPELERFIPPVSNSIRWARLIFGNSKYSILRFLKSQPDIFDEEEAEGAADGQNSRRIQGAGDYKMYLAPHKKAISVRQQYIAMAHLLQDFELQKFKAWESEILISLNECLRQSILCKSSAPMPFHKAIASIRPPPTWWAGPLNQELEHPAIYTPNKSTFLTGTYLPSETSWNISAKEKGSLSPHSYFTLQSSEDESLEYDDLPVYEVNFNSTIWSAIAESVRMELLGLKIPEMVRLLSLRRRYYQRTVLRLQVIVDRYDAIRCNLTPLKASLLQSTLQEIKTHFDYGVNYINWDSLTVDDFLEQIEKKVLTLETQFEEIDNCFATLDEVCYTISQMNLFKERSRAVLVSAKEYLDYVEKTREIDMADLARNTQATLTNALSKLEETLYNTNTRHCKKLEPVYKMFEKRVLESLVNIVLKNIWHFVNKLGGMKPIFHIDVVLTNSDIVLYPNTSDMYKWMIQTIQGCVGSTRHFVRWMRGSCEPCPTVRSEGDQILSINFSQEIKRCYKIHEPEVVFTEHVAKLNRIVIDFLRRLGFYSTLWYQDKLNIVEKWVRKKPRTTRDFENRIMELQNWFEHLTRVVDKTEDQKGELRARLVLVGALGLRLTSFVESVRSHLSDWIRLYLRHVYDTAQLKYNTIMKILLEKREVLKTKPITLDQLKLLLKVLHELESGFCETVDECVSDLDERYRLICQYGDLEYLKTAIPEDHWNSATILRRRFNAILHRGYEMAANIAPVKAHFATGMRDVIVDFKRRIILFIEEYDKSGPGKENHDLENGLKNLIKFIKLSDSFEAERLDLLNSERLLDLPISSYPELQKIRSELSNLKPLYDLYYKQKVAREEWAMILWKNVDVKTIQKTTEKFLEDLKEQPKKIRMLPCSRKLYMDLRNFEDSLQLIVLLKDEALRDRHWKQLMERTGISFDIDPMTFTLEGVFAMELYHYSEEIGNIVANAQREFVIEQSLNEIKQTWNTMKFTLVLYTKCKDKSCPIISGIDETTKILEDNMLILQSINGSRNAQPFMSTIRQLEKDLSIISDTLEKWVIVQQKWMYLEVIFVAGDIANQLPNDAKRFQRLDAAFRKLMNETANTQYIMKCCLTDRKLDVLTMLQNELELCQKALNDYLDAKRNAYPRFYFISDDEMLSILGGKEIESIQEHIVKASSIRTFEVNLMFDNIKGFKYKQDAKGNTLLTAMISCEEEVMQFHKPIYVVGKVEEWLLTQEAEMKRSNRIITKRALFYYCYKKLRVEWMLDFLGMVVLGANQIWFTWETEDVFRRMKAGQRRAMKDFNHKLIEQINQIVRMVRGHLTPNVMKKLETVLILDVHAKDIIEGFIRDSIIAAEEFEWESQLRFYWVRSPDTMKIRQVSAEFDFGYEYFGMNGRLVITPLTDRIYLTLTQALSLCLGGAPAGPAGTGKTETIKDLAKALGQLCVVTNCGESMDYKSFGRLMMGLCRVGCWGCFDEFNRIEVSVLSVVTSQIQAIQAALKAKATVFQLDGQETALNTRIGYFITMNPGYSGRTELPESVKTLFRPVVVIVPDFEYICEIMLFAQGFLTARELAKKLTTMYRLAEKQLSQQYHYDFGLRALKSVLTMAGGIRRADPDNSEEKLLMRALKNTNLPRFVHEDVPLFMGLVQDLFPGVELELQSSNPDLVRAATKVLKFQRYSIVESQLQKVIHLWDTLAVRHSVMLVGPTLGGKTTVLNTLANTQRIMGLPTKLQIINPKDRSVNELYGTLDPSSREWTDGLLSMIFRQINMPTDQDERRYFVFDGDVDSLWIENMNSVMDDNRLLTLVNGERIKLQPYCSLIFEVGDLKYASPATVSRCGMVYVDPKNLSYEAYWNAWLLSIHNENYRNAVEYLYKKYIPQLMDFIFEGIVPIGGLGELRGRNKRPSTVSDVEGENFSRTVKLLHVIPTTSMHTMIQFCSLLSAQLSEGSEPGTDNLGQLPSFSDNAGQKETKEKEKEKNVEKATIKTAQLERKAWGEQSIVSAVSTPTLGAMITDLPEQDVETMFKTKLTYDHPDVVEAIFMFCLFWAFVAPLESKDQIIVDEAIKVLSGLNIVDEGDGMPFVGPGVLPSHAEHLYDYMFDQTELHWVEWRRLVPQYIHNPAIPYPELFVPTVETIKLEWILKETFLMNRPLLMIGETGTSKTSTTHSTIQSLNSEVTSSLIINFSSRTSSKDLLRSLNANVEKRAKGVYGPMPGKKLIVFIDDLNMPQEDNYGTQQPIALLRMILERGGFYEQGKELVWRSLRDITYIGGMGPPGGGRRSLDHRLVSFFSIFHCLPPSQDSLRSIFGNILSGHFATGFEDIVQTMVNDITSMSVETYFEIKSKLLPTPTKFYYTFNLRDVSRVFQGLCQVIPTKYKEPKKILRLWRHEILRSFFDRLINDDDRATVNNIISSKLQKYFEEIMDYAMINPIIFGDYWAANTDEEGYYEDMQDFDVCKAIAEELMASYNEHVGNINLVLFNDALNHLSVIHRILRMEGGHALLVGVSGSGKKALARLAAFIAGLRIFEISLSKSYGEAELCEDIKKLYTMMAENTAHYLFIFDDAHVRNEGFLEFVNNILTTGCLVSLFADEDKESIINTVWPKAESALRAISGASATVTRETVWKWFARDCTARLHMALCMSPAGDDLRNRCRDFPGIVNCTTINWFFSWPEQALFAVACTLIDPEDPHIPRKYWEAVIENVVNVHISVKEASIELKNQQRRNNYVTSTNYIGFIKGFKKLLREKLDENEASQDRLNVGLEKLKETAKQIDELNAKMAIQKVILEEKTQSCEELLKEIESSTETATAKKTEAQAKSIDVAAKQKVITREKGEAEVALAEALPALEAAKKALDELDKADVTEFRAFVTPPKAVQLVGECLCYVMSVEDTSWKAARGLMADANFIKTLQTMDCEAIPQKNINSLKDLIAKRNMGYDEVRAASKAGGGFFKFILSVVSFYDVAKVVRPKRERVKLLEFELNKAIRDLKMLNDQVGHLEDMLANLRRQYAEAQSEMDKLKSDMNIMLRQLLAAEKLTSGLASEKKRWIETVAQLKRDKEKLLGHCLLASGFLNYLGPFTQEFRTRLLYKEWFENLVNDDFPMEESFKVEELLTSDVEISMWNSQGLPPDELSIQNAILTTKGPRTPVCIDPQGQAIKWLRVMERNPKDETRSIKITTMNDPQFPRTLENCIRFGVAIMFTGVEEDIDPLMDNVIDRDIRKDRDREIVMLGDREVEYGRGFRLYLTTKLPYPRFTPKLYSHALIINYTVTATGLEGQLLSALVKHEYKELEDKREYLIKETSENKRILKELEDRLLLELATQTGNILDNWELIETLEKTKSKAVEVGRALEQSAEVALDVDRQRNIYRPAARRGAILFFIIADLAMVDPMYQFSLSAFMQVFVKSLKRAMPNNSLSKRLENIKSTLTYLVFSYGCTAIFEEHKLLLSFQLAIRMQQDTENLPPKELNFFVHGDLCLTDEYFPSPQPWISLSTWRDCLYLASFIPKKFGKLPEHIVKYPDIWKKWFDSEDPEAQHFPGQFEKLEPFAKLCLIRVWRSDRVTSAISSFINATMGHSYVTPPITALNEVLTSTSPTNPIVLIVRPGADPPAALTNFAHSADFGINKIKYLSLGQGQETAAENLFASCMARGHWLVLQNCHLLLSYTSKIEQVLENAVNPHPDFRLWLTTEPVTTFPVGLLQIAYKVVMEPPSGLRQNITASLNKLDNSHFVASSHSKYRSVMFVLVFLHGILQERRRYGKLGWNVPYDFADADLQVSLLILQKLLNETAEHNPIKWPSLKYLIGEVMYGGRTIDSFDRRVLKTYMDEYFGDFLFDEFQTFHFYHDDLVDYMIPAEPDGINDYCDNFLRTVEVWPIQQKPNVFGLHSNTAIGYAVKFARGLWENLQNLLPETDTVTGVPDGPALLRTAASVSNLTREKEERMVKTSDASLYQSKMKDTSGSFQSTKRSKVKTRQAEHKADESDEEEAGEYEDHDYHTESRSISDSPFFRRSKLSVEDGGGLDSEGVQTKDAVLDSMAASILGRLPPPFDVKSLRKRRISGEITPTLVVLLQELDRFNLILQEMQTSLTDLRRAIAGEVGMSTELDDIAACLGRGTIPVTWRQLVPATEKSLADWLQQLIQRNEQYKSWVDVGRSELPVMWLSGLHLPQSYLTALIQKACRKNGWALDKCRMSTSVTDVLPSDISSILIAPEVGCNVTGLYLEGSAWSVEKHSLVHQPPRALIQEMPVIRLTPIERHKLKLTGTVEVPVYVTSSRRNAMGEGYVTSLDLPSNQHNSFWILEGACLILNTD